MVAKELIVDAFSQKKLTFRIAPTEACNFRCTYCFEPFELGRMKKPVERALYAAADRYIPGLKVFGLSWYGGEPLLASDICLGLSRHCKDICEKRGVIWQAASISTNAWHLTPELMRDLCDAGITRYMVSLDGDGAQHDMTRKLANGRATFERIYRNLQSVRDGHSPFKMLLRMHLHRDNIRSQFALMERLRTEFSADPRFDVLPVCVGDFGGPSVHDLELFDGDSAELVRELKRRFRSLESSRSGGVGDLAESGDSLVCYAAKQNEIFIRANGRLQKCTSAFHMPANDVGYLREDGMLMIDVEKALAWSFGFKTEDPKHLSCPLHHFSDRPQWQPIRLPLRGSTAFPPAENQPTGIRSAGSAAVTGTATATPC